MARISLWAALVAVVVMVAGGGLSPAQAGTDPTALTLSNSSEWIVGAIGAALVVQQCCQKGHKIRSEAGWEMVAGLAAVSIVTEGLKYTVRQKRPYPSEDVQGFPSGHTSLAFCFARILDNVNSNFGIPAYAWAAAVGWARVRDRDHTTEQALAGALLGQGIGNLTVHYFSKHYPSSCHVPTFVSKAADRLMIMPVLDKPEPGVQDDPGIGVRAWQQSF